VTRATLQGLNDSLRTQSSGLSATAKLLVVISFQVVGPNCCKHGTYRLVEQKPAALLGDRNIETRSPAAIAGLLERYHNSPYGKNMEKCAFV